MHRHRIVVQITLILSILNLVLAAPIVVQERHDARDDEAKGVPSMPNKPDELGEASDRPRSQRSQPPSQDAMAPAQHSPLSDGSTSSGHPAPNSDAIAPAQHSSLSDGSTSSGHSAPYLDAITSPQHSSLSDGSLDGSTSSANHALYLDAMGSPQHSSLLDGSMSPGHPTSHLSSDSSGSGYSWAGWLVDGPPRLSPDRPASHGSDSSSVYPNSDSLGITLEEWLQGSLPHGLPPSSPGSLGIQIPEWLQGWEPERSLVSQQYPAWWFEGLEAPPPSSAGSLETPPLERLHSEEIPPSSQRTGLTPEEILPSSQRTGSDQATISASYSSASDASLSSHYFSASDPVPSHHLTLDDSPPSLSSPPTETPPDNANFFKKNMKNGLKILAGLAIVGGVIGGIVGLKNKHHDSKNS